MIQVNSKAIDHLSNFIQTELDKGGAFLINSERPGAPGNSEFIQNRLGNSELPVVSGKLL